MASGPTIVAKFLADTSQMEDGVDKAASGAGSKLGDFAKKAAFAIGGAFAVDKIIDFGKASVEAAAADAEAADKLAQTLRNVTGATDDQIASSEAFISNLSKQAAIADDDLRPAMDTLVRGFGNAEDAQKALSLATDVSAGTGKDLSTVSEALMKASMGSTGALKKMGVEVENADGSAKSLDQIMGDMSKTFSGQAAVAAEGTAGKMRNAEIQFGEFQEQIGTALLPVLSKLAGFLVETLIPALSGIASWMSDNKEVLIAGFIAMATVIGMVVVPAFIAWATTAGAAALATLTAMGPIIIGFALIGAAVGILVYLVIKHWDTIVAVIGWAWEWIKSAATTVWEWIKTVFGWIVIAIQTYIGLVIAFWTTAWDVIKAVVTTLWDWIQTIFGWIVEGIGLYIATVIAVYTTAWNVILAVVTTLWDWIQTVFGWIVDGIKTYVNTWIAVITGAWDAIKNGVTAVWEWIRDKFNAVSDAVHTAVDNLLGWVTWGWDQIKSGATSVWQFVTDKFQAIADFFSGLVGKIGDTAKAIADAIKAPINWVIGKWNDLEFGIPEIHIPEVEVPLIGKMGGGTVGGQRFETNNIPLLAGGGVLTNPTLFVGGEAGTEIVAPEDMLRAIVAEESRGTYIMNIYPRTADASDIAYGFRRLELLAGVG